ncbi:hypothetical protein L208DRAFT_1403079 [Tricholoma matsutake]|nr:hypothetical protein L208DRAFT_1403079 [Tricholoma matsutake 945]
MQQRNQFLTVRAFDEIVGIHVRLPRTLLQTNIAGVNMGYSWVFVRTRSLLILAIALTVVTCCLQLLRRLSGPQDLGSRNP